MMLTHVWVVIAIFVVGLVSWHCWYLYRRAQPTSKQDESMRRHVNRNYSRQTDRQLPSGHVLYKHSTFYGQGESNRTEREPQKNG